MKVVSAAISTLNGILNEVQTEKKAPDPIGYKRRGQEVEISNSQGFPSISRFIEARELLSSPGCNKTFLWPCFDASVLR